MLIMSQMLGCPSPAPIPHMATVVLVGLARVPTIFVDTHGRGGDVRGHVEVRQPQVLQGQRLRSRRSGDSCGEGQGRGRHGERVHLDLLVLEDTVDAAVEGRPREHGGDRVGEVQHGLQN